MWCARPNYRSREEFKKFKEVERETKNNSTDLSADFKVALVAVTSDEDYKSLEAQYLLKKIEGGEEPNTPLYVKIEYSSFLSPHKMFSCRLFNFGPIILHDLLSNIMFIGWMCGAILSNYASQFNNDTSEFLRALERVKIFGCTIYASLLFTMKKIKNDPVHWRWRWIYFHLVMGMTFVMSIRLSKVYREILWHGCCAIYPLQILFKLFAY